MAYPEDLLEQARHLARREPKRPKQASLRRSVSTAYYALFHLLIAEAAMNWKRVRHRHSLSRAFDHGRMRQVSEKKRKDIAANFKANPRTGSALQHLLTVTGTFVQLQQQRHIADYDGSKQWSRTETLTAISNAEAAFQSWKTIRNDETAQDYLVSLLIKDR